MFEIDIGFAGTVLGALIGALALLVTVRKTAEKVHDNFKADKLAEAKRDIFLNLVDRWMNYLMVVNSFKIKSQDEYRGDIFQATKDLLSSLHKSSFISAPKTKKEVMLFTFNFTKINIEQTQIINNWYHSPNVELQYELFLILDKLAKDALDLQNLLRVELGIKNDPQIDLWLSEKQKEFFSEMKSVLFHKE